MLAFLEIDMREREKPGTLGTDIRFRCHNTAPGRSRLMAYVGSRNRALVALCRILRRACRNHLEAMGLPPATGLTVVKRIPKTSDGRRDVRSDGPRDLLHRLPRRG